jgi:hypothetical protein
MQSCKLGVLGRLLRICRCTRNLTAVCFDLATCLGTDEGDAQRAPNFRTIVCKRRVTMPSAHAQRFVMTTIDLHCIGRMIFRRARSQSANVVLREQPSKLVLGSPRVI